MATTCFENGTIIFDGLRPVLPLIRFRGTTRFFFETIFVVRDQRTQNHCELGLFFWNVYRTVLVNRDRTISNVKSRKIIFVSIVRTALAVPHPRSTPSWFGFECRRTNIVLRYYFTPMPLTHRLLKFRDFVFNILNTENRVNGIDIDLNVSFRTVFN